MYTLYVDLVYMPCASASYMHLVCMPDMVALSSLMHVQRSPSVFTISITMRTERSTNSSVRLTGRVRAVATICLSLY